MEHYRLKISIFIILLLALEFIACTPNEDIQEEGVNITEEYESNLILMEEEQTNVYYDNADTTLHFNYINAINYENMVATCKKPEYERIVTISQYGEQFPIALQDVLVQVNCSNIFYTIPTQYLVDISLFTRENNEDNIFSLMSEYIHQDKFGSPNYIIDQIGYFDITGDGVAECIIYGTMSNADNPTIFSNVGGEYKMLSLYNSNKKFEILQYDEQVYILCDNRLEFYCDNEDEQDNWYRIEVVKEVSNYQVIEIYSQEEYLDIDMMENVNIGELQWSYKALELELNNEKYYAVNQSLDRIGIETNDEYDFFIVIYKQNSKGEIEVVKIYYIVSNLEISFKESTRENVYQMDEMLIYN